MDMREVVPHLLSGQPLPKEGRGGKKSTVEKPDIEQMERRGEGGVQKEGLVNLTMLRGEQPKKCPSGARPVTVLAD